MFRFGCLGPLLGGIWGILFHVLPLWFLGVKAEGQWGVGMVLTVPLGWLLGLGVGLVMGKYRRRRSAMIGAVLGALASALFVIGARYSRDWLNVYDPMFLGLPVLMVVGTLIGALLQRDMPELEAVASVEGSAVETYTPGEDYTLK